MNHRKALSHFINCAIIATVEGFQTCQFQEKFAFWQSFVWISVEVVALATNTAGLDV
jgi:hypothetical protein